MKTKITLLLLILLFLVSARPIIAADPHLFLSPTSGSYSSDFNLEVRVDTGGRATGGVDAVLEFPKDILSAQQVVKGNAFSEIFSSIKNNEGRVLISAYFPYTEAEKSYTGTNGLVATVLFKPISSGVAAINFVCQQNATNDSNIIEKTTSQNIIVCSANVNGSYNIAAGNIGSGNTPTPTPTSLSSPISSSNPALSSPTPIPTLPVSGISFPTVGFFGLGLFFLLTGVFLVF